MPYSGRRTFLKTVGITAGIGAIAGCTEGDESPEVATFDPGSINRGDIVPDGPIGLGPTGHEPVSADVLELSESEKEQIRDEDLTVSVIFQYLQSDWVRSVRQGMEDMYEDLNVEVEGVHGVNFDAGEQVDLLENLAALGDELDAIITYPVDTTAAVGPLRELRDQGVEVVIITNTPPEFEHGVDFAGMVTVDNYGLGLISARILKEAVGSGKIGVIEQEPELYVIDERERAVHDVFDDDDDIETVVQSFTDAEETFDLVTDMLTANPDMDGLWTPWASPPANEARAALQSQDIDDVHHTSVDLNEEQAELIAEGRITRGLAVGDPYGIGQGLVRMAAHAHLGNETPAYASVPTHAVMRDNVLEMWEQTHREDPPDSVLEHFEDE